MRQRLNQITMKRVRNPSLLFERLASIEDHYMAPGLIIDETNLIHCSGSRCGTCRISVSFDYRGECEERPTYLDGHGSHHVSTLATNEQKEGQQDIRRQGQINYSIQWRMIPPSKA